MNPASVITSPEECKVFTPPVLAAAMAGVLGDSPVSRWLEPCVGKGVFLDALAGRNVAPDRITAIELDQHEIRGKCGEYHSSTDFLTWSLRTEARFDRIIGNPPFLKLHRAHEAVIKAALRVERPGGGTVPLRANCWYAFLCACLKLLNPGGGLCLILPAGWEYADYAADLRDILPKKFAHFEIVRGSRSFFEGNLDGCIVLIAEGYGEPNISCRRVEFPTLTAVLEYLGGERRKCEIATSSMKLIINEPAKTELVKFGEVARVRIGAVTGDARYFLLNESRRAELGIDLAYVKPVLTRARHLEGPIVTTTRWRSLRDRGERVWLFWPYQSKDRQPKAIWDYLDAGLKRGTHTGQKTRERDFWYLTEINPPADAFMSGMTSVGPWLCLNRTKEVTATNTLYTIHFRKKMEWREKSAWALSLLCATSAAQYESVGRCYSKGLLKFEPQDVMDINVQVPVDMTCRSVDLYKRVVADLLSGKIEKARESAEAFVTEGRILNPAGKIPIQVV